MSVPTDHTLTSSEDLLSEVSFDIKVDIGCYGSALDDFTLTEMQVFIKDENLSTAGQDLLIVQDSVSKERGDQDGLTFCGER
jgi:hypothetical protein